MRNNLNFIKRVLYKLRQDYGLPATLVQIENIAVDYKTGTQGQTKTTYELKRIVKLPGHMSSFNRIGMALGIFNRGGESDRTITEYVIDAMSLPIGVVPDMRNNYLIIDSKRYNITKVIALDNQLGYLVMTEATEGAEL
jgi:hypothetical protein